MDSPNRRKLRRLSVSIPAGVYFKDRPFEVIDAEIVDISEGGAFVRCVKPIKVGEEVLVEIRFGETRVLQAKVTERDKELVKALPETKTENSVVRWAKGEAPNNEKGFGIEFTELKDDKKQFLMKLFSYFDNLSKAGVKF